MTARILIGDVRKKLAELPDESVHCVVTSPPYFGLRDYGVAGQIGLEPTPAEFVAVMVDVFREVFRVLRKDGSLWLNLGDSYNSTEIGRHDARSGDAIVKNAKWEGTQRQYRKPVQGLKPKDLMGIPWRVAFALQADGWYLRQDIIWSKPNPMPESVTDRCTKSHEYIFLFSRSARYHYDAEAIAEAAFTAGETSRFTSVQADAIGRTPTGNQKPENYENVRPDTRNRRSVWTVATQPFKEAHFATFPPDLIEPCIKAGCPKDCCAKCGAPVVRQVTASGGTIGESWHNHQNDLGRGQRGGDDGTNKAAAGWKDYKRETTGWLPSCTCDAGLARGVVLDPFFGAGTTGLVADRLQRDCIGIELNPAYAALAKERLERDGPLFSDVQTFRPAPSGSSAAEATEAK